MGSVENPQVKQNSSSLNTNPLFGFSDAGIEHGFRKFHLARSINQVRSSLFLAAILSLCFAGLDKYYFDSETFTRALIARAVGTGFCIISLIGITWYIPVRKYIFHFCGFSVVGFTAYYSIASYGQTVDFLFYYFPQFVQFTLFILILFRIPFRLALTTSTINLAISCFTIWSLDGHLEHKISMLAGMLGVQGILLMNLCQREKQERELFLNERQLASSLAQQEKVIREQNTWNKNFGGFVRHELANQLTGIRTSLELINRFPEQREAYVKRGQQSLRQVQYMLSETAAATSIDEALAIEEREVFSLSELVFESMERYADDFPQANFSHHVEANVLMQGQPFRINQLLDKLISNAVRHSNAAETIEVSLTADAATSQGTLKVTNYGDPLPDDVDSLFELWVSGAAHNDGRRLGLGLYIAARIVEAHQGAMSVAAPVTRPGATFTCLFPLVSTADAQSSEPSTNPAQSSAQFPAGWEGAKS